MSGWHEHEAGGGERYLTCAALTAAGLPHAFTLRPAPGAKGQGRAGIPRAAVIAAGIDPARIARPAQVHGCEVARPAPGGRRTRPRRADAVLVTRPGAAAVTTADCVGGILAAPEEEAFVVLHAGWRGILSGVVGAAVAALSRATGAEPAGMLLATGPSARRCCYEIGSDVSDPFSALFPEPPDRERLFATRRGRVTVEPAAAVEILALRAGLAPEGIHRCGLCTICRTDLCYSYRVEGRGAGRMWTLAALPGVPV